MKRFGAIWLLVFLGLLPVLTLRAQGRGEILRAEYGSGYRWIDVTQRVRSLFRGNNLSFRADNQTLGGDPAPGVGKTLRLVMRENNGRIRRVEFAENQNVTLRGFNYGNDSRGLRILGAQYGVENRMIDVTDRVSGQIRGDQLNLRVTNQMMGGDPAKGLSKSLWVWYTFNGRPGQAVANENGVLSLPVQADYNRRDLLITQAQYGSNDRFVDVTARLNAQVRDGQLNVQVTNQMMGGDPARGQGKALQVWYTFNGRPGQAVAYENEVLNLPGEIAYNNNPYRNYPDYGDGRSNNDGRYNNDGRSNGGGLQITRALYGAGTRVTDVTDRLNAQIQGDRLSMQVMNQTMGADPARGQGKTLTVWYTFNGRPGQVAVNENGVLNLPGPGDTGYSNGDNRDNRGYPGNNNPGNNNSASDIQTIRCESNDNQRKYCSVDTRGGVLLLRALSNAPCNQGSTWGFDQNAVWVDYGCRADFQVRGGGDPRRY